MNGLLVISHQMEDVESMATKALLTRAGFHITTVTFETTPTITAHYGTEVTADLVGVDSIEPYDFLIIPGGKYVGLTVDTDVHIKVLANKFYHAQKWIAAICAGPRFLLQENLISGHFTAYPGSEVDAQQGTYLPEQKAVVDFPFITARSAGSVYDFVFAIIQTLQGEEALLAFKDQIQY